MSIPYITGVVRGILNEYLYNTTNICDAAAIIIAIIIAAQEKYN